MPPSFLCRLHKKRDPNIYFQKNNFSFKKVKEPASVALENYIQYVHLRKLYTVCAVSKKSIR